MEVIIHGTKGGYNTLHKTSNAPLLDIDIRNNTSSEAAIGEFAYSIAFIANGSVFTKYIIIRDSLRSHATGTIAFSLILSKGKELVEKGKDVQSILDELSSHYLSNYVKNNNINNDESSHVIEEDWSFVNNILIKYQEQDKNRTDIAITSGEKEAAFIFYKNDIEMQNYYSKPFQEEYARYKQILFISKELESLSAELLNVLKNSGVELKGLDLGNEYFYLNNYIPNKGIEIYANGESLSRSNNAFRANDELTLKFVKDDRYYFPIADIKGTITDSNTEIYKYLKKTSNQIIIDYNALSEQKPRIKNITFKTISWNEKSVNAEISYSNSINKKTVKENQVTFTGEEIGQQWIVSAKNNEDLYSEEEQIIPEEKSQVKLTLNEYKSVKFFAVDSETRNNINNFKVKVDDKLSNNIIKFKNDNIRKKYKITIQCQGYTDYIDTDFCPATSENIIELKSKKGLSILGGGKISKPEVIAAIISGIIILGAIGVFAYKKFPMTANSQNTEHDIIDYVNGNDIYVSQLDSLKKEWKKLEPEPNLTWLPAFGFNKNQKLNDWTTVYNQINSAINKRNNIDSLDFAQLKILKYSDAQQNFIKSIEKLDTSKYEVIRKKGILNVSVLNLNQIADSINVILNPSTSSTEETEDTQEVLKDNIETITPPTNSKDRTGAPKEIVKSTPQKETPPVEGNTKIANKKTNEILNYIQGSKLEKAKLEGYLNDAKGNSALTKSIILCLNLWNLNGIDNLTYCKMSESCNNDDNLENSELCKVLKRICDKDIRNYSLGIGDNIINKLNAKLK
jgi:hypothetical protein